MRSLGWSIFVKSFSITIAVAIILSLWIIFSPISSAEGGSTASCPNGTEVKCYSEGGTCSATDGVGCSCVKNGKVVDKQTCPKSDEDLPVEDPQS